jgi:hypothetical protein
MTSVEHQPTAEEVMACFDGELPPEQAASVESHVAECAICRRVMEGLRDNSRELAEWALDDPPASLQLPRASEARGGIQRPTFLQWAHRAIGWRVAGVAVGAAVVFVALIPRIGRAPKPVTAVANEMLDGIADKERSRRSAGGGGGGREAPAGHVAGPATVLLQSAQQPAASLQIPEGPMIAGWARLDIIAASFDEVSPAIDRILREVKGFAGNIDATAARGSSRSLNATLRVPAGSLDAAIASLKRLGHVVAESRGGDDVTEQVVDIAARLANARNTEVRLTDVLRQRTGKVSDVLEAEREIARVRGEIERLDAERKNLDKRVTYATLTLRVSEEPKAALDIGTQSVSARYRNALVDGLRGALESLLEVTLVLLRVAPTLAVWAALLFWPVRIALRRSGSRV